MAIYRHTAWTQGFKITDKNGVPINLTSATFEAKFRKTVNDDVLLTLNTANNGINIVDAINGRLQLVITALQSATLPLQHIVFDVLRTDLSPGPVRLFGGSLVVKDPITR